MVQDAATAQTSSMATMSVTAAAETGYQVWEPGTPVVYSYIYNGDKLSQLTVGGNLLHFAYDASGAPMAVIYNGATYYYVTNLQGDVIAILNSSGTAVVEYTYDAWGNPISTTGSMASTLGETNPLRYRGYVYDEDTELYYLQSRYYNPTTGRFLNADEFPATGQGLLGNNMFAYCGNNPIVRQDFGCNLWDTVFDIISLGFSIVEVCTNPSDPWAWLGLVGDIIDVAVPFVGGVGEITKAIGATAKVADNVVDAAKIAYKGESVTSDLRKAHGSYEIIYKSGKNYVGKGSYKRAINSAERYVKKYGDEVTSITWKSAPTSKDAYIDEYYRMMKRGVNNANTYNQIWSPGRTYHAQALRKLLY